MKDFLLKVLPACAACFLLLAAVPAQATTVARGFGPNGTTAPQLISELGTTVASIDDLPVGYQAIGSSNSSIRFVRHILGPNNCLYWFRADAGPDAFPIMETENWETAYWDAVDFVDGAQDGSDNFVLLHDALSGSIVGVLQYLIDHDNGFASLLAYAINIEGITFDEGVAAIQAIPEPSTVAFVAIAVAGAALMLRRRRR